MWLPDFRGLLRFTEAMADSGAGAAEPPLEFVPNGITPAKFAALIRDESQLVVSIDGRQVPLSLLCSSAPLPSLHPGKAACHIRRHAIIFEISGPQKPSSRALWRAGVSAEHRSRRRVCSSRDGPICRMSAAN